MAKFYKRTLLPFYLFTLLLFSCQEGREAGDLWGQWRMDGSDTKYISFSGAVTQLKDVAQGEIYGNFQHQGDSLFIQCYSKKGDPSDTIVAEQSFGFRPLNDIRLRIVTLDGDRLVLSNAAWQWTFEKW